MKLIVIEQQLKTLWLKEVVKFYSAFEYETLPDINIEKKCSDTLIIAEFCPRHPHLP